MWPHVLLRTIAWDCPECHHKHRDSHQRCLLLFWRKQPLYCPHCCWEDSEPIATPLGQFNNLPSNTIFWHMFHLLTTKPVQRTGDIKVDHIRRWPRAVQVILLPLLAAVAFFTGVAILATMSLKGVGFILWGHSDTGLESAEWRGPLHDTQRCEKCREEREEKSGR